MTAAERARRYRARLAARGLRLTSVMRHEPLLDAVCFADDTALSPGEQDVLRRFCGAFGSLPQLPARAAVFGSRARGASHPHSDLDVAVLVDAPRDPAFEPALSAIALAAQRPYWFGAYGIMLRPVPFYAGERTALLESINGEMEVVWTRP